MDKFISELTDALVKPPEIFIKLANGDDAKVDKVKKAIEDQIEIYCPLANKYGTKVDVEFTRGEVRDIAQINIEVDTKYLVGVYVN